MKRLLAFVLALILALSFVACGGGKKTFFDEFYGLPVDDTAVNDIEAKLEAVGAITERGNSSSGDLSYNSLMSEYHYNYDIVTLFGYSGKLTVQIWYTNGKLDFVYFFWEYDKEDMKKGELEKVYNRICKNFSSKYGKYIFYTIVEDNDDLYQWTDEYNNHISARTFKGQIRVSVTIDY